ncbi:MAG: alpha/beta hydrolase [Aestuariivirgaceae bacterium]|nr:alpha/beta hydrolase [Aestuariivirgaceae bacterium]
MSADSPQFHEIRPGVRLAYLKEGAADGTRAGLIWLGGLRSDMTGTKAAALAAHAKAGGRACLRFDYTGHGASDGAFTDATISDWLSECEAMFLAHTAGPTVICGSSMGGWLALLLARRLKERVAGLILLAPATDMTEKLMWEKATSAQRATLMREGQFVEPSAYNPDDPLIITKALIEDGRQHSLMGAEIPLSCPVRILQGDADPDVPWEHGLATYQAIRAQDCRFTLIKGGDHRLSSPGELALLVQTAEELCGLADG